MKYGRALASLALPAFLFLAVSPAAAAPRDSLDVFSIEEVEVRATRIDLPLGSVAPSVDIVTRDEAALSEANTAAAAIGHLPGVFIEQTGDFGQADISIRGLGDTGRRVMILMDGHPVKSGLTGATFIQGLTVSGIDQIELVRTPGSVIYGSDALGGVVNIVSSPPPAGFALRAKTSYGSYDTYRLSAFTSARIRRLGCALSVDRRQSDGHLPNSEYRGTDFLSKVTARAAKTDFTLVAKYYNGFKEEPAPSSDPPGTVSDAWTDYTRGTVDLEVSSRFGGGKSTLKAYMESGDYEFSDGWHSTDKYMGLMAYQTRFVGDMTLLNGGLDFRHQRGEVVSPDPGQWSKYEYGFYCLAQFFIKEVAVATAGLRINIDENSAVTPAPHLGIVYDITDATTLRGSVSGGFRSPQIDELYMFETSNSALSPETIWSFELGFTHRIAKTARLTASAYRIYGQDFIELVTRKGHGNRSVYENVGEIEFTGVEASLSLTPHASVESRISYAYLDPGPDTAGRPGDKLDMTGILHLGRFTLLGNLQYVGDYYAADNHEERIDDYLVVNARFSSYIAAGFDAFFSIENIADEEYDIFTSVPGGKTGLYRMPGRRFIVGVTYDLGK